MNDRIAKLLSKPDNLDHFGQSNNCYPEMFPELVNDSTDVIGKKGSVICLNTGALHRETQNTSADKTRYVIILSYTENIPEFKRHNFSIVANIKNINSFYKKVNDKQLVSQSFHENKYEKIKGFSSINKLKEDY